MNAVDTLCIKRIGHKCLFAYALNARGNTYALREYANSHLQHFRALHKYCIFYGICNKVNDIKAISSEATVVGSYVSHNKDISKRF